MKKILLVSALLMLVSGLQAQKYFTRSGQISFFSSTSVEDIEAHNKTVTAIFDSESGAIQFSVTMKSFQFEKALMQEHFNESYIESETFPTAKLSGKITNISSIDITSSEEQIVKIECTIVLHGVEKSYDIQGTIQNEDSKLICKAEFEIRPEDHNIKIPKRVAGNIAESIEVTVKYVVNKL